MAASGLSGKSGMEVSHRDVVYVCDVPMGATIAPIQGGGVVLMHPDYPPVLVEHPCNGWVFTHSEVAVQHKLECFDARLYYKEALDP